MPSSGNHWFVAVDAKRGDGSRNQPFHDPWLALRSAEPGDFIHIAAGTYYGRYDRSSWIVDRPRLTILGGYSANFSERTPWQTPSVFAAYSGYEVPREANLIGGRGDHSGLVLDGLFFDASGRNTYGDQPVQGLRSYPSMDGPIASFSADLVAIRNCAFANSTAGGVELSGDGSVFENNLVFNIIGIGMLHLRTAPAGKRQLITVTHNTFCFAHDVTVPPGTGADSAIGVRIQCPAIVEGNVFVGCGNAAIALYSGLDRIRIDRNCFYLTPHDLINSRGTADITEDNLDELEDLGLRSAAGNIVQDPHLTGLPPEWLDAYTRHLLANYAKPPRAAANAMRTAAGLPALAPGELDQQQNKGQLAPRLAPSDCLALRVAIDLGCQPQALTPQWSEHAARPDRTYQPIDWSLLERPDAALANRPVELHAALGSDQNVSLLADAQPTTHVGICIYQPAPNDGMAFVLAPRHTLVHRLLDEAARYSGSREAERTYLLRGIYRIDVQSFGRQRATLVLDSIAAAPLSPGYASRPQGRDWFVCAGAGGGDGTREKPFRDPFQALDQAVGGDTIHVAGGTYFSKLHSGKWRLTMRNLTLLGGYDNEFTERDPWRTPTRFLLNEEQKAKGSRDGTILASDEPCDGLVLDGFLFDGATYNTYTASGSLDLDRSPSSPLVRLGGGSLPIEVRNCVFINASSAAIHISCPSGVFENNLLINANNWLLSLHADGPGPWLIRHNTFLFACDPTDRAGTGKSSPDGTALVLAGRAEMRLDANIFAFADNYGVRAAITQQNLSFSNNVFAANLFNHLTDEHNLWADSSNWERRAVADSPFASFEGNTLQMPALPINPAFADLALSRLFTLPSRISAGEWKTIAALIGSSAVPVSSERTSPPAVTPPTAPAVAPSPRTTLSSLLGQLKKEEPRSVPEPTARMYCPALPWEKALALAQAGSVGAPGAHRLPLTTSFTGVHPSFNEVQYAPISPQQLDTDHTSLDNRKIKLVVSVTADWSSDPSYFPTGTTRSDFYAFSVITASPAARTPIAIIVQHDSAASRVLRGINGTDRLQVCGTAHIPRDRRALAIVIDTAERLDT
jgi:hypothetical protein